MNISNRFSDLDCHVHTSCTDWQFYGPMYRVVKGYTSTKIGPRHGTCKGAFNLHNKEFKEGTF